MATAVMQRVRNTASKQLRNITEVLKPGLTTNEQTERPAFDDHRVGQPRTVVEHDVINLELTRRNPLLQESGLVVVGDDCH